MRVFWAAFCVAVFACLFSFRADAQSCAPIADHIAYTKAQPAVVDTMPLDGEKLQKVIAYIQAINGDDAKYDGQVCNVFVGPVQHLPRLIEAAEGRPA